MTQGKIYLFSPQSNNWLPMSEAPYVTEDSLQEALANFTDLIPGDQINPEAPRRWLLIKRELGIPGDEGGGNRFSLDHLFVDQDAVPTFVECKRASDTRARREVVAQMLDYAANGTVYWPPERLRQAAAETAKANEESLDERVMDLLDSVDESEIEQFWLDVENNLRQGHIRLIFVADQIHQELRRLVEFLNEKMADVEVLAVEIKQYEGEGQRAMVPRVLGLTEATRKVSKASEKPQYINRDIFLANCAPHTVPFFSWMIDTAEANGFEILYGQKGYAVRAVLAGQSTTFAYGFPPARFQIYFHKDYRRQPEELTELRAKLMANPHMRLGGQKTWTGEVTTVNEQALRELFEHMMEVMQAFGHS